MFYPSISVLMILVLFTGFSMEISNGLDIQNRRSMLYHGPFAPIKQVSTVALTPEVQARFAQEAAFGKEHKQLQETKRLAAAHPDYTSPENSFHPNDGLPRSKYNQVKTQQHTPKALLYHDGSVASTGAQKAAIAVQYKRLQVAERLAAPQPDMTSSAKGYSLLSKENQNQQNAFQYNQGKSYSNSPQYYIPAPLNKDGTVAFTPEVLQARAAHQAAFAAEFQRLDAAARLAAAHPDFTFPQKSHSNFNNGHHNRQQNAQQYIHYNARTQSPAQNYVSSANKYEERSAIVQSTSPSHYRRYQFAADSVSTRSDLTAQNDNAPIKSQTQYLAYQGGHHNYNPEAHIPAPLNLDGTVAHTAEYRAIAAAHQAEYARALQRNKQRGYFSTGHQSYKNNFHNHRLINTYN